MYTTMFTVVQLPYLLVLQLIFKAMSGIEHVIYKIK